ncbi:MAG: hypothetical protein AAF629_30495 [Chloroflexota bacterium]
MKKLDLTKLTSRQEQCLAAVYRLIRQRARKPPTEQSQAKAATEEAFGDPTSVAAQETLIQIESNANRSIDQ